MKLIIKFNSIRNFPNFEQKNCDVNWFSDLVSQEITVRQTFAMKPSSLSSYPIFNVDNRFANINATPFNLVLKSAQKETYD